MASLRLAFLTKSDPDSGNFNTAQRICEQLVAGRPTWQFKILSVADGCHQPRLAADLTSADVLLCLHLYRCAPILIDLPRLPPLIGIAGGTDLNVDSRHPDRSAVMRQLVCRCKHIVVFSESLHQALTALVGDSCGGIPVSTIPQGIPCPLLTTDDEAAAPEEDQLQHQRYFIILGRIRPVKNCCSVLEPFHLWSRSLRLSCDSDSGDRVQLLFVGDIEDSEYGEDFKARIAQLPDIRLLCGVHHRRALQLMRDSLGLINCSLSEGQSNSILEAMSLGVPAIVSAVPGNLDLVRHLETGFVFEDDKQLIQWMNTAASQDSDSRQLVQRITVAARVFVQERHSTANEQQAYFRLITDCCEKAAAQVEPPCHHLQ